MGAPNRDLRPQYGWDQYTFVNNDTLGEPGGLLPSSTVAFSRPNGMYRVTVAGRVEALASSGDGRFGFYLEGSNTGGSAASEWIILAETNLTETFLAGAVDVQAKVLAFANGRITSEGFIGEATVPCDRWRFLRVRTFVSYQGPGPVVTFEMDIRLTGIGADGQRTDKDNLLIRVSGDTVEPVTDPVLKPSGVRYVSMQAYVDAMIIDPPGSSFTLLLEVAQNKNAVNNDRWIVLDELGPFDTTGQTAFFENGKSRLIDLSGFDYFRFTAVKDPLAPPNDISSYSIRCLTTFDDADWIDGEQGIPLLHEALRKCFIMLIFDPKTGAAPNWEVRLQICDMNQTPIRSQRRVGLLLTVDPDGFSDDLSPVGTFVAATTGTLVYGAGNNVAVVETEADGTMVIQINDGGAASLRLVGWNEWLPRAPTNGFFGPGQVLICTERAVIAP